MKVLDFSSENHRSWGIDYTYSRKRFLDPDSENTCDFDFRFNTHSYFPKSGFGKHFQTSRMYAIDSSHKITPMWVIFGIFEKHFVSKKHEKIYNFTLYSNVFLDSARR